MKTFKVIIYDELFGELESEFDAPTKEDAMQEARDYYSIELGDSNINITSIYEL